MFPKKKVKKKGSGPRRTSERKQHTQKKKAKTVKASLYKTIHVRYSKRSKRGRKRLGLESKKLKRRWEGFKRSKTGGVGHKVAL